MRITINAFKEDTSVLDLFKIVNHNFPIFSVGVNMSQMNEVVNVHFTFTDFMDIKELYSNID